MLTEEGKRLYKVVDSYNLGGFYQETVGNIIIEPRKLTVDVMADVLLFLSANTDWVLGYEDIGCGEQCLYITPIKTLER